MTDIIIIGGGPAGLTAALYCTRAGLATLLIESNVLGGQIAAAGLVENYPGVILHGSDLAERMAAQAAAGEAQILHTTITAVDLKEKVVYAVDQTLSCRCIIFATGASPRTLGLPNESELIGRGVSYCATCDGRLFKNRTVAVVGGGNSAVSEALELSRICAAVHLIYRKATLRAETRLQEHLRTSNVVLHPGSKILRLHADDRLHMLTVETAGMQTPLPVDGLFIAIGREPQSALVDGQLATDENGYIHAGEDTKTSIPGVFVAGDVRKKQLRQIVTATADGAMAAHQAISYLTEYPQLEK